MKYFMHIAIALCIVMMGGLAAAEDRCGEGDPNLRHACKRIKYMQLPQEVRKLMKNGQCDVTAGSNYDYGYTVDINDDRQREILFCCRENPHGPCDMSIFGKVKGTWKILSANNGFAGYDDGQTLCPGIDILKTRQEGYRDICQYGRTLEYRNGGYQWKR